MSRVWGLGGLSFEPKVRPWRRKGENLGGRKQTWVFPEMVVPPNHPF